MIERPANWISVTRGNTGRHLALFELLFRFAAGSHDFKKSGVLWRNLKSCPRYQIGALDGLNENCLAGVVKGAAIAESRIAPQRKLVLRHLQTRITFALEAQQVSAIVRLRAGAKIWRRVSRTYGRTCAASLGRERRASRIRRQPAVRLEAVAKTPLTTGKLFLLVEGDTRHDIETILS